MQQLSTKYNTLPGDAYIGRIYAVTTSNGTTFPNNTFYFQFYPEWPASTTDSTTIALNPYEVRILDITVTATNSYVVATPSYVVWKGSYVVATGSTAATVTVTPISAFAVVASANSMSSTMSTAPSVVAYGAGNGFRLEGNTGSGASVSWIVDMQYSVISTS